MLDGIQKIYLLESNGFTVELSVSEKYDILTNASSVAVGLRIKSANQLGVQYLSGSIKIDGEKLLVMDSTVSTHNVVISSYNTWYKVMRSSEQYTDSPWTKANIAHDPEGARNITLELEMRGYGLDDYLSLRVAATKTVSLTNIPRASKVTATDANIGAVSTVSVLRRVPAYTHSIAFRFGDLSGYLSADGSVSAAEVKLTGTNIPFLLPESFYHQIPASSTGECRLTVKTYSGNQQIGDPQSTNFTVTAAKSLCQPQVWGSVEDVNAQTIALTGNANILVRYVSNALCRIGATARNGATIVSRQIAGQKTETDERLLAAVETGNISFHCTDSRGYSSSVDVEKTLVPYIHLTANITARRTDPTSGKAVLELTGNWFNGRFGAEENNLSAAYTVNGGAPVSIHLTVDGNTYKASVNLSGLDYLRSHSIRVTVSDRLQTVDKSATVGKGIPVFDWDEDDFQFHVPVSLAGNKLTDVGDPVNGKDGVNLSTLETALRQKAPSGAGYGEYPTYLKADTDTDGTQLEAMLEGFMASHTAGVPYQICWECYPKVDGYKRFGTIYWPWDSREYAVLTGWTHGGGIVQKRKVANKWQAVEWVNPPMEPGVEYCTTECRNWQLVYKKLDATGTILCRVGTDGTWKAQNTTMVKLWENASRTSSFSPQTISLDLSGYDEVLIYSCLEASRYNDYMVISRCPVGETAFAFLVWADDGARLHRSAHTSSSGIVFNNAYHSGGVDNASVMPYRIYGIKGVK